MLATNFNTKNDTYRKLMGNGLTYGIPRFQRDYSWDIDQWDDLWVDIMGTLGQEGEPAHYMGYLVLQTNDDKYFDVIDGQQRITTINIIILAVLRNLKVLIDEGDNPQQNQQRLEQIRQAYIGYLDPVTLASRSKLTLNRHNNTYYQTYIVPLSVLPIRGFNASEHLLRKASNWYEKNISEYLKRQTGDRGTAAAQLVESICDKLFFTVISVADELNAYKVFETLNSRGVSLSSTDLLKNYLFSVLDKATEHEHEHEMKALEERWEAMVGRLGSESFPNFLRTHWNGRRTFVRHAELFKVIRGKVANRQDAFRLLQEMEEDVDSYLALASPEASDWSSTAKEYARTLNLFNVKQPYSLIIAARRQFAESEFEGLLRACVIISLRYNVIGNLPAHDQETVYHTVAQKISQGAVTNLSQALILLKPVYPGDASFGSSFAEAIIRTIASTRNNRIVRYLLCALEKQLGGQALDFQSDSFGIEHVLPQKPEAGWESFTEDEIDGLTYRLGNMTLMSSATNRDVGNAPYERKRPIYAQSNFAVTRKLAEENAEWTPARLAARQNWMAKQAVALWRIAQLS